MKLTSVAIAISLLSTAPAFAAPEDVANDVSEQIMSPYCPGVTLHDCPSDAAIELRDRIEAMAEQGMGRAEIIAVLEREYGASILAMPPASGSGLLAWLLPIVAALSGAALGWMLLRKWVHVPARPDTYQEEVHITPSDRRRLDVELEKFRGEA